MTYINQGDIDVCFLILNHIFVLIHQPSLLGKKKGAEGNEIKYNQMFEDSIYYIHTWSLLPFLGFKPPEFHVRIRTRIKRNS